MRDTILKLMLVSAMSCSLAGAVNLVSLSPSSVPAGTASQIVTINGTGFTPTSTVSYNGSTIASTYFNPTKITISLTSQLANAGSATVSVSGSNNLTLSIPAPIIISLNPTSNVPGPDFILTVTGSNFISTSKVRFDGTIVSTAFVNSTQLNATVTANMISIVRNVNVNVVTGAAVSAPKDFVIGASSLTCVENTAVPPIVRFEGSAELLGDVVLLCTGGFGSLTTTTLTVTASVNLTSRILNAGTNATEALLLIDEPTPAAQKLNTNVFQGVLTAPNTISFINIPIQQPGNSGQRILRFVNLRANAHQLGAFSALSPPSISVNVTSSDTGVTIQNPQAIAGFAVPTRLQSALNITSVADQRSVQVGFSEGFASAFKIKVDSSGSQSTPGQIYNTESGFVNQSVITKAGLADSGTRLLLQLSNVPAGVSVYAAVLPDNDSNAKLVSTDSNGAGVTTFVNGSSMFGGTYAPIAINGNGSGVAVWEIVAANPNVLETHKFRLQFTGMSQPGLGPIVIQGSPAPLSATNTATATDPLPRFSTDAFANFLNMSLVSNATAGIVGPGGSNAFSLDLAAQDSTPQVQVGSTLSFLYGVVNNGPSPASQVTVASTLPPTLLYTGCTVTGGGSCTTTTNPDNSTTVSASYSNTVVPGQTTAVDITAQPLNTAVGTTLKVVTVVSNSKTDPFPDDNTITTTFGVTSTAPGPVPVSFSTNPSGLKVQVGAAAGAVAPTVSVPQGTALNFAVATPQPDPLGTAGKQYSFDFWNNGSTSATQSGVYPPIGGGFFTATFDTQYQVNATSSFGGAVALAPTATNNYYPDASEVVLTATPAPGYAFTGFTGDVASASNPLTLLIQAKPINIKANFAATQLALGQSSINFAATSGGTQLTDPQVISVIAPPGSNWTVTKNQAFISVSPTSGKGNGSFTVSLVPGSLPSSGTATATITVTDATATNSPQTVAVGLAINPVSNLHGSFDTPIDGTTGVAGAIAVTGWALDNIEVTKVDIWREKIGSEAVSANGLVYIGDAVFVAGARPDVQALYPTAPFSYRAGWGYLMLTNELPNNGGSAGMGNGFYKLHAIAHNTAGLAVDLGSKVITGDNAHATRPFGTIDTPNQGGTISGNPFINFGWALTQNPHTIPFNGSTIAVTVDGVTLGSPTYNNFRADIATLFPGLNNSMGAIGYYFIDPTKFTNGVHSIAWLVFDDAGRGDGIGSRFFNVANAVSGSAAEPQEAIEQVEEVQLRRGFGKTEALAPKGGVYKLEVEELDRIELHLGAASGSPLPPGSTLKAGTFYWQLAPVFSGTYPIVFRRPDGYQIHVHVHVNPKTYQSTVR